MNVVIVRGRLSSAPRRSELGSGDVLVRYEVTVPRAEGPADSVPVAWLGSPRRAPSAALDVGDEVFAVGRVRRRWYRPTVGPSRSATEVVADCVVAASDRRKAKAAVARALEAVHAG